ncbi:hypothetical protein ERJ75_000386100 [Trypanosoma vivax]|nr:hypothetical protein ERJ75_000386100 [Trypanosoma vivax]
MTSQLERHIFTHDWSDARRVRLAAFVASHLVSTVRAQPVLALCDAAFVSVMTELHATVFFTVSTSERTEAAQQLYQTIALRLLAILNALGAVCDNTNSHTRERQSQLLRSCLAGVPPNVSSVADVEEVGSISAVSSLVAMLAVGQSLTSHLCDVSQLGTLLIASLLWIPDMRFVLLGDDEALDVPLLGLQTASSEYYDEGLCRSVARHAKELPFCLFYSELSGESEAEISEALSPDAQLLLLLRSIVRRSVQLLESEKGVLSEGGKEGVSQSVCGALLRRRTFSVLLAALLVPNDVSMARVLLVWEAAMEAMSDPYREALCTELLLLGDSQVEALFELSVTPHQVVCLRRFLNAVAVLLAEACRLLHRSPETFASACGVAPIAPDNGRGYNFCHMASILYHQSQLYQWWLGGTTPSVREAVCRTASETVRVLANLHDNVQSAFGEWKQQKDHSQRLCTLLASVPGLLSSILRVQQDHEATMGSITSVFLVLTQALQSFSEAAVSSQELGVCARFVASELVGLASFVACDDQTFVECVRRLVAISFLEDVQVGATGNSASFHEGTTVALPHSSPPDGMLQYHAAVSLRQFAQRNVSIPLEALRLTENFLVFLKKLLHSSAPAPSDEEIRARARICEETMSSRAAAWCEFACCNSRCRSMATESITTFVPSSNNVVDSAMDIITRDAPHSCSLHGDDMQSLASLQRCDELLRQVLRWQESTGRALEGPEEEALNKLGQLVEASRDMSRSAIARREKGAG